MGIICELKLKQRRVIRQGSEKRSKEWLKENTSNDFYHRIGSVHADKEWKITGVHQDFQDSVSRISKSLDGITYCRWWNIPGALFWNYSTACRYSFSLIRPLLCSLLLIILITFNMFLRMFLLSTPSSSNCCRTCCWIWWTNLFHEIIRSLTFNIWYFLCSVVNKMIVYEIFPSLCSVLFTCNTETQLLWNWSCRKENKTMAWWSVWC